MKPQKNNRVKSLIGTSLFISVLIKISDFFFGKILTSKAAQLFCSYNRIEDKANNSLFKRLFDRIRPGAKSILKLKNSITKSIENSLFYRIYHSCLDYILGAKAKLYGTFFMVYGFFSVCVGFVGKYAFDFNDGFDLIWQGAGLIVISLFLAFSKSTIGELLVTSKVGSTIIDFLELKKENILKTKSLESMAFPICFALVFGLSTFFVQPLLLFGAIALLIVALIIFYKPEIGVLAIITLLPFTPTMLICAEIIAVFFAFLLKVLRGKRTFKVDILDVSILAFTAFVFFGGAFSVTPSASLPASCVFVCFMIFYFVIVNLVRTSALVKKILTCSLVSCAICSLYGIYQNFFATPDTTWTDEDMFSDIETRVVSTFENPNVFGEYLILLIPVCITMIILAKKTSGRLGHFVCLCASVLALVYTWSRGAWLGFIASMLIFMIIISRRAISFYLLGLLALPVAIPMLPSSIIERFSSIGNMTDTSTSYRVFIWEASVKMIRDFLFTGIGVGTSAFQTVYSEYALAGIETAPHSHNLYLQILVEHGIFGFLVFLAVILLFFSKIFTFMKNSNNYGAKIIVGALTCGIIAFLLQGVTDYVWYNYRVFGFFWMMLGLCVSAVNASNVEDLEKNDLE